MIARSATLGEHTSLAIRLHQAIALLDRFPLSIIQLMFRVAIAAVFWSSGLTKIASWDTTIALFRDEYMVPLVPPAIAAVMSATFELSCSALIVVGLATRLATLPLLGMTLVIEVFVYPEYWTMHLMWASILLFLLTKARVSSRSITMSITYSARRGSSCDRPADGGECWPRPSLTSLSSPNRRSKAPPHRRSRRLRRRISL